MLQQTRVDTVIPYYEAFMKSFPTLAALAESCEDNVLKHWQGLGYYSRVRNLHKAAQIVVAQYDGCIPKDEKRLSALPGVGPYTCGALLSIAYDEPVPAVDGNVLRVFARYYGIEENIASSPVKSKIYAAVQTWMDGCRPSDLTQAIMELGAIVCTPKQPRCHTCPIVNNCVAEKTDSVDMLPVREKKKPRKPVYVAALWLVADEVIWLEQRGDGGLLANMWQLPSVEASDATLAKAALTAAYIHDVHIRDEVELKRIATAKHIFTHLEWYVDVYRPVGITREDIGKITAKSGAGMQWVPKGALALKVFPRVYEKIFEEILGERVR